MVDMLLLSNSGAPYLDWASTRIEAFLSDAGSLGFVSAARLGGAESERAYYEQARAALSRQGRDVVHLRWEDGVTAELDGVDAVFVGGGNTFALLSRLRRSGMLTRIADRVRAGMRYLGSSAGTNITCPTVLTTNDWNVTGETEFGAAALFPWQINPHYFAAETGLPATAQREPRIAEFHQVSQTPVVAIEEQTGIIWNGDTATLFGMGRARIFQRNEPPRWLVGGESFRPVDEISNSGTMA